MQYFVSIENNSYHRWQAELLIESFKYHHIEDDLIITIADNATGVNYTKNLLAHENKFVIMDFGQTYNKLRSLMWALESGVLKSPFTVLHPDMVLLKPIEEKEHNIVFNVDEDNILSTKQLISSYVKSIVREKDKDWFMWMPLGSSMIFKDVPNEFFTMVYHELELLVKEFGHDKLEIAAWLVALYKYLFFDNVFNLTLKGDSLEQNLADHGLVKNLIHYRHGLPPEFNKHYFKADDLILNESNPFDSLLSNNVTSSTDFVCELIKRYLA